MTAPPTLAKPTAVPPGIAPRLWLVIWPDGQRNYMEQEPLEGMAVWAKGVDATIIEYGFTALHRRAKPPPPPPPAKR